MFGFHLPGFAEEKTHCEEQDEQENIIHMDAHHREHHREHHTDVHHKEHHKDGHHRDHRHHHHHHQQIGYQKPHRAPSFQRQDSTRPPSNQQSEHVSRLGSPAPDPSLEPTTRASMYEHHKHEVGTMNTEVELTLKKLLEATKSGNRELREMHGRLKEKMEDVSNYTILLEERLAHFKEHVRKTDEEMDILKDALEHIEREVRLGRNDEEILRDIADWKGAHCKATKRQRSRKEHMLAEHHPEGYVPGMYPEVRVHRVD